MTVIRTPSPEDIAQMRHCAITIWKSLMDELPMAWVNQSIQWIQTRDMNALVPTEPSTRICFVADDSGTIVGFIEGNTHHWGVNHLTFIGVDSHHRRHGIGSQLFQRYLDEVAQRGVHKIRLSTLPTLHAAIRLYVKHGFIPEGYLRQEAHGMDVIIYSKFF